MTTLLTEEFPYTARYATELLTISEENLLSFVNALSLSPRTDERTGHIVFNHSELDLLKKAVNMNKNGKTLADISSLLGKKDASRATAPTATNQSALTQAKRAALNTTPAKGDNIAVIVEAVSQAKEGILKDMSRLLDDKLIGLDEVVVELIRCKSENDTLKQKLQSALEQKEHIEKEIARFKRVQFGFYRKTGE